MIRRDSEDNSICYNHDTFSKSKPLDSPQDTHLCLKQCQTLRRRGNQDIGRVIQSQTMGVKSLSALSNSLSNFGVSTHVVLVLPATLTIFTDPSQYFVTFFRNAVTCCASSLVGTNMRDRILLSASCCEAQCTW